MTGKGFHVRKPEIDPSQLKIVTGAAERQISIEVADDVAAKVYLVQEEKSIKPVEAKSQIIFRLRPSDQLRINKLAAQKTTASNGAKRFSRQDIFEAAILEYLAREELLY